jgi:hypothetical protein
MFERLCDMIASLSFLTRGLLLFLVLFVALMFSMALGMWM